MIYTNYDVNDHRYHQHHYYAFSVHIFVKFHILLWKLHETQLERVLSRSAGLEHQGNDAKVDKLLMHANANAFTLHIAQAHAKFYDENHFSQRIY